MSIDGVPFTDALSTTLDATGKGTVKIGPKRPNVGWSVNNVQVGTTDSFPVPTASVYVGSVIPANRIAATFNGSNDTTDVSIQLYPGEFLTVVWETGQPKVTATVTVAGTTTGR